MPISSFKTSINLVKTNSQISSIISSVKNLNVLEKTNCNNDETKNENCNLQTNCDLIKNFEKEESIV